jgi:hypothetical protein
MVQEHTISRRMISRRMIGHRMIAHRMITTRAGLVLPGPTHGRPFTC